MRESIEPVAVLNYGVGNVASVCNSLRHLDVDVHLVDRPEQIQRFRKLVLPGVGAFAAARRCLHERRLDNALVSHVRTSAAQVLGVCLGMQLLFDFSMEGCRTAGLGLVSGGVYSLAEVSSELRVPHIGWNTVSQTDGSRLLSGCGRHEDFYFAHTFYCSPENAAVVAGTCTYGASFAAVVESETVMGCQFHPEKSQRAGLRVLRNFVSLPC